ncbi:ROK family protein [Fodinicola feengrottensis]|uniref:ROK family protein n=1 Tax=Fodinicola feengrottensis TaxID=435914 RepID=A0ABN2GUP3_9ACTN
MTTGNPVALSIDVGGTKIAVALVHADGTLLSKRQVPTPRTTDGEEIFASLAAAVASLHESAVGVDVVGVGLGCAGPVELRSGTVRPVNIAGWRDFPLRDRVAEILPRLPVWLLGDGLAIALGEHRYGAARGTASSMSMVVSTGVGGGLVLDGQPYPGPSGNAGHIGHIIVQVGGDPCPCGSHGCLETIASGTNIARWALAQGWQPSSDSTARGVFADAAAGDAVATASIDRAGDALGAAIVSAGAMVDLDRVVIGGGVAQAGAPFFDAVRAGLHSYAGMPFVQRIEIVPAELGTTAGLAGAAALAFDRAATG